MGARCKGSAGSLRFFDGGAVVVVEAGGAGDTTAGEDEDGSGGSWGSGSGSGSFSESEDPPYETRTAVSVRFIDEEKRLGTASGLR